MIAARELRIGNIVEPITMSPIMVTGITQQKTLDGIFTLIFVDYGESFLQEHLNPIPLTEEWLIKFGFECFQEGWYGINPYALQFEFTWNIYDGIIRWKGSAVKCNYVHQLQNLYFALTGTELTIQP